MLAGIWKHYKGGLYQVLGIGEHSESKEKLVVYVALEYRGGPRIRCRPLSMWEEIVTDDADAVMPGPQPRFRYLGDEIPQDELDKRPYADGT